METEDLKKRFRQMAQGALSLDTAFVGVANGLFPAIRKGGSLTVGDLARETGMDKTYLARWCDAAYAFDYLEEKAQGQFCLTALGEAMCPDAADTLMPIAVGAVLSAHMAERATACMRTGEQPGEAVLAERKTILPWFGSMIEASFAPLFSGQILPRLEVFAEVDANGGTVVDLGCGNGWYLVELAKRYPRLRGIGLDGFEENIRQAAEKAKASGLEDRLRFVRGDIRHYPLEEPASVFVMNRALHHVWSDKETVFSFFRDHLASEGSVVIWEPAWPENRADLKDPARRQLAFQGLSEHVQGNRLLSPAEIGQAFSDIGLDSTVLLFANGNEAVILARKRRKNESGLRK